MAAVALVGCGGDSTGADAATPDGGDEAIDCKGTAGTRLGAESSFPVGTWTLRGNFIIAQDQNGFFAYSSICTHAGCTVNQPSSNNGVTVCPCHGSEFDGNGKVLVGPAQSPLQHFAVNICNGFVYVDDQSPVATTDRTPAQ